MGQQTGRMQPPHEPNIRVVGCNWANQSSCCQWDFAPTSPVQNGTLLVLAIHGITKRLIHSPYDMALPELYNVPPLPPEIHAPTSNYRCDTCHICNCWSDNHSCTDISDVQLSYRCIHYSKAIGKWCFLYSSKSNALIFV